MMGWINLCDPAPPGFFTLRDEDPYYISPEDERAMAECPAGCDHGRVLRFRCKSICDCGRCPEVEDCPECCGHEPDDVTDEQFAAMLREVAEDQKLADGTHYLDANGSLQPKPAR